MGKKRRQRPNDSGERPASVEKGKATWKRLKIPPLLAEGGADDGASVYSVEKLEGVRLGFEKGPDGKSKLAGIYMDDETVDFKTLAKICNNEDAENEDLPSDFGEYVNVDEFDESGVSSNGRGFMKVGNKMEVDRGAISRIQSPSWADLGLRDDLIAALKKLKFDRPTEIQESMIPVALNGAHDVFGAAETGSGKTLAFGIPIIQKALDNRDRRGAPGDGAESPGMTALIIEPTRELAAQVTKALEQLSGPLKVKV